MKITKYGHACLLVEEGGATILLDPGVWNPVPEATGIDAVFITHEHQDHIDIPQVTAVLGRNPDAVIYTHEAVGRLLEEAGLLYTPIAEGETVSIQGVPVQSFGHDHAIIYGSASPCRNTGFLINERLYVPGDALHDVPLKPVEILALPTGAPWMKLAEAIEYAKKVRPKVVFPIHDAMYTEEYQRGLVPRIVGRNLEGIEFRDMQAGAVEEF
ncbi:MAG TPA: MBL fold metallo-hydrolase [Candidatus Paceibacterota bacterium]|nr:MBL fold metallo-hydrolase [Candidatus Paceibacterota bacterium]